MVSGEMEERGNIHKSLFCYVMLQELMDMLQYYS